MRPPSSVCMAILKPSPSLPSMFFAGTFISSKNMEHECAALMPIFLSGAARRNPGVSVGTRKAVMPLLPFDLSVMVKRRIASATGPLVIQFFEPLMTYSSPLRTATVFWAAASEPASGSVRPKQPSFSPRAKGTRNSRFCSSVPNFDTGSQ